MAGSGEWWDGFCEGLLGGFIVGFFTAVIIVAVGFRGFLLDIAADSATRRL